MRAEKGGMGRQEQTEGGILFGLRSDLPIIEMFMQASCNRFRMSLLPNDSRSVAVTATEAPDGQTVGMWGWIGCSGCLQGKSAVLTLPQGMD